MSKSLELFKTQIINIEEIAPNYFVIDLDYNKEYIAGQVVAITTSDEIEPRLYSIAGSFASNSIRILFDLHEDGMLTPVLSSLSIGSVLKVSNPFGRFLGNDEPAWWIATGTGIAPYIAMSQQFNTSNKQLIYGARKLDGFLYDSFFKAKLGQKYIRCCTTESGAGVYGDRLTKWLEQQTDLPLDIKYYLCGNPEMVVDVRDLLVSKGVNFKNIISEIYF